MIADSTRVRTFSAPVLSLIASGLFFACNTDAPNDNGDNPVRDSVLSLEIRHIHFTEPGQEAQIIDDLPETIRILLNGIPGNFFGTPTEDTLFSKSVSKHGPFRIPLDELSDFPNSTQPAPYVTSPFEFGSVTPASVGIMRIGTFADLESEENVLSGSGFEGYGLYDLSLKTMVTMVYFSGAARIQADYELCDSSRFKADIVIPEKGFYFLYQKTEGRTNTVYLSSSAANLVFSVTTLSQAYEDYFWTLNESQRGCFSDLAKTGAVAPLPPAFRFWMSRP